MIYLATIVLSVAWELAHPVALIVTGTVGLRHAWHLYREDRLP